MIQLKEYYTGKRVLVTGHTGFKGAWLTLWLKQMGSEVIGFSLPPQTEPNLFDLLSLEEDIKHIEGDIRDYHQLKRCFEEFQPEIVFHLAAQAIVLDSYKSPKETFDINALGTVNVLEAIRTCHFVKAAVMVTTDKCYENRSWLWGYRENDPLGGHDPYSASKSMAELSIAAYRDSFFSQKNSECTQIASVRAGNIIGGGDFSEYRILPDSIKALMNNKSIVVRNPKSARPWLYVLDALNGYLMVGAKLINHSGYAESWNFGPKEQRGITVEELVEQCITFWGSGNWSCPQRDKESQEMALLRLNWDKAAARLGWEPICNWKEALKRTAEWYKAYHKATKDPSIDLKAISLDQILAYSELYLAGNTNEIYPATDKWSICH